MRSPRSDAASKGRHKAPRARCDAETTIVSPSRFEGLPMLGAILVILTLIAGAAYVAQVGTGFTLLFIGAVIFMAYKRLPLIAFTVVFTLLLAGYTWNPWEVAPSGVWKGFIWVLLAAL